MILEYRTGKTSQHHFVFLYGQRLRKQIMHHHWSSCFQTREKTFNTSTHNFPQHLCLYLMKSSTRCLDNKETQLLRQSILLKASLAFIRDISLDLVFVQWHYFARLVNLSRYQVRRHAFGQTICRIALSLFRMTEIYLND